MDDNSWVEHVQELLTSGDERGRVMGRFIATDAISSISKFVHAEQRSGYAVMAAVECVGTLIGMIARDLGGATLDDPENQLGMFSDVFVRGLRNGVSEE